MQAEPFGRPHAAGDVVAVLEKVGSRLYAGALDAATGRRLWRQEASPGVVSPSEDVDLTVTTDRSGRFRVLYLRPVGDGARTRVVAADARTGADVAVTDPLYVVGRPSRCEVGPGVCFSAARLDPNEAPLDLQPLRMRLPDGRLDPDSNGIRPATEPVGPHQLYRWIGSDGEYVTAPGDGPTPWVMSVRDLFGPGASFQTGGYVTYSPRLNLFVASVSRSQESTTVDLSAFSTVAFDAATGRRRWIDQGSIWQCNGSAHLSESFPEPIGSGDPGFPIRCRLHGTVTSTSSPAPGTVVGTADVEGVDPTTGRRTWSVSLASQVVRAGPTVYQRVLDGRHLAFETPAGLTVVDLRTGQHRPGTQSDRMACLSMPTLQPPKATSDQGDAPDRFALSVVHFCDGAGALTDRPPAMAVLRYVGASAGGVVVVARPDSWEAYR